MFQNVHLNQNSVSYFIDESTTVGSCGLYKDSDEPTESAVRNRYPWLIKIVVTVSYAVLIH